MPVVLAAMRVAELTAEPEVKLTNSAAQSQQG